jgi:hypothetical protein
MSLSNLLSTIEEEIKRLQQARALLAGSSTGTRGKRTTTAAAPVPKKKRARRRMSAEGRERIAEAQRKRWAAKKAE